MFKQLAWILSLTTIFASAHAAGEPLDLNVRYPHSSTSFYVNEDGTAVEERSWSMTVLKESAVAWAKTVSVTFSTSAQQGEVLEAYTRKVDGRKIDASKDSHQIEINKGREAGAPVYSDMTTMSVVLPDVAVGDTIHFAYRLRQTEPLFPGHFDAVETFSRSTAIDRGKIRIDYPTNMKVRYTTRELQQQDVAGTTGRKVLEWTFANPTPVRSSRRNFSVYDPEEEVGLSFSTFASYAEVAAAYGARAHPKAAVTDRVRAIANDVTHGKSSVREQARALYDWVVTNITYAGNCVGVGSVVPRDLAYVLDHRMGDCKDHATLLQSLLAAKGIRSTQALINAGSVYRLPEIPVVSMVNHVINYIPELDLFVDATSKTTPFGLLPQQVSDKPVLLIEGYRDDTRTPATPLGSSQQKMLSKLKLLDNGTVTGTVEVEEKGYNAAQTRAMARAMSKDVEADLVKNMYRAMGAVGFGRVEKDDPTELSDAYRYKASIQMERFVTLPGAGAFHIVPLFNTSLPIYRFLVTAMEPELEADVACGNASSIEEYRIELPKRMKVLSIPPDTKVDNGFLTYTATYRLKGNILTARRSLDDRTKGNVCSPEISVAYQKFAEKVLDNLKAQVLFK